VRHSSAATPIQLAAKSTKVAALRVAVISDIHANLAALNAVLAAVDEEAPDELWCLGDLVGYGPRPNECCALVRERADVCLVGNHDLAVLGTVDIADFSPDAAAAARWTEERLDAGERRFLASLEPEGERAGVSLYHGSARDPVWEYVLSAESAAATIVDGGTDVALVGHSHVALAVSLTDGTLSGGVAPGGGAEHDLADARWLLNPGSVGQPRDGDPRAAFLVLDLDRRFGAFRRVPYPVEKTQRELRDAGLPETLAARLAQGK
jgi:predicted phosphodiesterase